MNKTFTRTGENRRGERGSILAMSAVGMLTFILATGLCVDISHFYLVKGELKNAADAAALAGASALNSSAAGISNATDRAVVAMNKYEFGNKPATIEAENVEFAVNFDGPYMDEGSAQAVAPSIRFVRVTVPPKEVGVFFATSVIGNAIDLTAEATAGMSVPTNVYYNSIPLSVVDDDVQVITPGNLYTIRSGPQNSVSPGNYQILAIDGSGASDDRIGLASSNKRGLSPGDYVDTKPGVSAGAVRQGINTRFDDYGSQLDPVNYPPDTNIKEGITYAQYRDGTSTQAPNNPGVPGRRIVVIPIIKKSQFDGGRTNVQIDRFGAFFLRTKVQGGNGGDIEAEYIGETVSLGGVGYNPNAGVGNNLIVTPVLYK